MSAYTYKLPDKNQYFNALQTYLSSSPSNDHKILHEALKGGTCNFYESTTFSGERWDAYYSEAHYYLSPDKLPLITEKMKAILKEASRLIMPKDAGYDIIEIQLAPQLEELNKSLTDQLHDTLLASPIETFDILPEDLVEKGKNMTEVYTYLYYVENSLRIFVEEICKRTHGDDYFDKISLNRDIRSAIARRISEEEKHTWMRIRGSSKIFYLDFVDIASLIINNWDLFRSYFPDQQWLNVKIGDMAKCRNYVAHNSFIDELERNVLKASFSQILRQISRKETTSNPPPTVIFPGTF